jgi:hypothetical protein
VKVRFSVTNREDDLNHRIQRFCVLGLLIPRSVKNQPVYAGRARRVRGHQLRAATVGVSVQDIDHLPSAGIQLVFEPHRNVSSGLPAGGVKNMG